MSNLDTVNGKQLQEQIILKYIKTKKLIYDCNNVSQQYFW